MVARAAPLLAEQRPDGRPRPGASTAGRASTAGLAAAGRRGRRDRRSTALLGEATEHAVRVALEKARARRARRRSAGRPYELPALPGGVDLGGLYELAELLVEQGVA